MSKPLLALLLATAACGSSDPVERTLSLLRRRRAADDRFLGRELEDIYADPDLQHIIRNHMVKMLSLTVDEMGPTPLAQPVAFDAARLDRAFRRADPEAHSGDPAAPDDTVLTHRARS